MPQTGTYLQGAGDQRQICWRSGEWVMSDLVGTQEEILYVVRTCMNRLRRDANRWRYICWEHKQAKSDQVGFFIGSVRLVMVHIFFSVIGVCNMVKDLIDLKNSSIYIKIYFIYIIPQNNTTAFARPVLVGIENRTIMYFKYDPVYRTGTLQIQIRSQLIYNSFLEIQEYLFTQTIT